MEHIESRVSVYFMFIYTFLAFFCCFSSKKIMFLSFYFFFWWRIKFPQQNINQSVTEVIDKKLSMELYSNKIFDFCNFSATILYWQISLWFNSFDFSARERHQNLRWWDLTISSNIASLYKAIQIQNVQVSKTKAGNVIDLHKIQGVRWYNPRFN